MFQKKKLTHEIFAVFLSLIIRYGSAQLLWSNPLYPFGSASWPLTSNGRLLTLSSDNTYAWIMSDPISVSTTPVTFYVTLMCSTTITDFGLQVKSAGASSFDLTRPLLGDTTASYTDKQSIYFPFRPSAAATSNGFSVNEGKTIKWAVRSYTGSNYAEVRITGKLKLID